MEHTGNHITLCGTLRALPEYSHSNHERRFFRFELEVERLSGTADVLPVIAAEDVLMAADLFAGGRFLVEGQIRSFNSRAESGCSEIKQKQSQKFKCRILQKIRF